jgi:electron transport complex protein RnfG
MSAFKNEIMRVGLMLGLFAVVATTIVAFTEQQTRDQIKENERIALMKALNALVPASQYDNDILTDTLTVAADDLLGSKTETLVYRARKQGEDVASIFTVTAPDGYSGRIKILVGINADSSLAGVRVIEHKETPGLGDKVDEQRTDWILQFKGLSLTQPDSALWKVKKDGGEFDQFTGATITPRAVVKAIKKSLLYFEQHRDTLFAKREED